MDRLLLSGFRIGLLERFLVRSLAFRNALLARLAIVLVRGLRYYVRRVCHSGIVYCASTDDRLPCLDESATHGIIAVLLLSFASKFTIEA